MTPVVVAAVKDGAVDLTWVKVVTGALRKSISSL